MSDERDDLRVHVRDEHPPAGAAVVIRGGPDTLSVLRSHARRINRLFVLDGTEVFGISVFVASSDIGVASERQILRGKLGTYDLSTAPPSANSPLRASDCSPRSMHRTTRCFSPVSILSTTWRSRSAHS